MSYQFVFKLLLAKRNVFRVSLHYILNGDKEEEDPNTTYVRFENFLTNGFLRVHDFTQMLICYLIYRVQIWRDFLPMTDV